MFGILYNLTNNTQPRGGQNTAAVGGGGRQHAVSGQNSERHTGCSAASLGLT